MYSIGNMEKINLADHGICSGDAVIFCLGEIDCRCHIHKHIHNNPNVINELVENYISTIKASIDGKNVNAAVYNVVPPSRERDVEACPGFPCRGTDEERKNYTEQINTSLEKKCKDENILFIDVYSNYVTDEGFLDRSKSDGNVHINDTNPLSRKLKEINLS